MNLCVCGTFLDLSKSIKEKQKIDDVTTPTILSSDTEGIEDDNVDEKNYGELLKKIENKEEINGNDLIDLDIKKLVKSKAYREIQGKGKIRKILSDLIENEKNSDENTTAYFYCDNCLWSTSIPNKTKILSVKSEGVDSMGNDYYDENVLRNFIFYPSLPRTRNFKCPNKKCRSHFGEPSEACFFRKNQISYDTIYCCSICHEIKMNT
jgi:hypothetical protein